MRMLKPIVLIIMSLVFLMGFAIYAFPFIQSVVTDIQIRQENLAFYERYDTEIDRTEPEEAEESITPTEIADPTEPTEPTRVYHALREDMEGYNLMIWEQKQSGLCDPWSYQQPSFSLLDYGLEDEAVGVISIPALNLEMPIYLGASAAHMGKGAAHLSQTSLPIGGVNTNCVIAGHRGYRGATFFRYVTDLKPGDQVIITNLWESLTYTVVKTQIIWPNEVDQILIQEGRDLVTLLTCHPYASGGKQRFLVFCERNIEE